MHQDSQEVEVGQMEGAASEILDKPGQGGYAELRSENSGSPWHWGHSLSYPRKLIPICF